MSYIGVPGYAQAPTPFHRLLQQRVTDLLDGSGLRLATDMQEESHMGMLSIFAEVDDEDAPEYDDRPVIEVVLGRMAKAAKSMKQVRPSSQRTLGCLPDTCAAVIVVDTTFTPVADEGEIISGLGKWSMLIEDDAGPRRHYGNVKEVDKLKAAFADLKATCDAAQAKHGLTAPVPPPNPLDVMREMRGAMGELSALAGARVPGPVDP